MNFEEMVSKLEHFWEDEGCTRLFPYDQEVGAGTLSPYTFLRVLGRKPWKAVYVQPSRRPADGRYGENPNRLYTVSYTHLRAHETRHDLVCRLLLEKKKKKKKI